MSDRDINRVYRYFYNGGPRGYSAIELSDIIKGIVVSEVKGMRFESGYGSASATIPAVFALKATSSEKANKMIEWMHAFGFKSYYFPYTGVIKKSPELYNYILQHAVNKEVIEDAKIEYQKYFQYKKQQEEQREKKKNEAQQRKLQSEQLVLNDKEDRENSVRESILKELNTMTTFEKLTFMSNDKRHSIKFYPTNMAYDITQGDIEKLSFEQKKNLIKMSRLKIKRHSPWANFKKALKSAVL